MGGSIQVTSEEGVGSKFTVRLPFQHAGIRPGTRRKCGERGPRQLSSVAAHDWLAGRVFLVADDNPINLHLVETLLAAMVAAS